MSQSSNQNGKKNPAARESKPPPPNKPTTTATSKPDATGGQTKPPPAPGPGTTPARKLSPRQEVARKKAQKRRQLQILITGVISVVAVVAIIVVVLLVNSPYNFKDVPAQATTDTAPLTFGSADAKVTLIEYLDMRCSVCKLFFDEHFSNIKQAYVDTGKIKYELRNYTVIDERLKDGVSAKMAQGAMCAADQKRSIDFVDTVYRHYPGERVGFPDDKWIKDLAGALKLNTQEFNTCLDNNKYRQFVADQKQAGSGKGVSGTPTFFVKVGNEAEEQIAISSAGAFTSAISAKLDEALKKAGVN
jgi:protein-disulfide isomerase